MYIRMCALAIIGVSASVVEFPFPSKFHFERSQYRRTDSCNICYGSDCLPFDQDRCDYYSEANGMLPNDDVDPEGFQNPQLRNDVDSLMFDIIEKATQTTDLECIPYLSRYTDCDKENVCIGCKTCECNSEGKWNCVSASDCRIPDLAIDINHHVLVTVVENLLNSVKSSRRKRSKNDSQQENANVTITPEEIDEWLYGFRSLQTESPIFTDTTAPSYFVSEETPLDIITETAAEPLTEHNFSLNTTGSTSVSDSDYLAFDEVLNNIAIETKNYTRRKPPPQHIDNESINFDYMLAENDATPKGDDNTNNNEIEISSTDYTSLKNGVTETSLEDATKMVIDLLETVKNSNLYNETDFMGMLDYNNVLENTNNIDDDTVMNLIKREISTIPKITRAPNSTYTTERTIDVIIENSTERSTNKTSLKKYVLLPLIKIINQKDKEMEELEKIKKYLITFMNANNQSPIVEILDYPNISETNTLHDIEMFPDLLYDLRRNNHNIFQTFLNKLKTDIYEVTRDIMSLKQYEEGEVPEDLSILVDALQKYVNNVKSSKDIIKNETLNNFTKLTRRRWEEKANKCLDITFKQCIIEILQIVDKDMPTDNAIGALTSFSKRIIRSIIRKYYNDEITGVGLRVHDPTFNLTNDLKTVGNNWQGMTNNIIGNSPYITLYRMKLVHFYLKIDINKMADALTIIDFAQNRRMTPFLKIVENNVIDHINNGLKSIYNKMQLIIKYYSNPKVSTDILNFGPRVKNTDSHLTTNFIKKERKKKKHSFIKHIRNLLKSSRKDVNKLNEKLPKSEIVKQLALKKLNSIAQKRYLEYEEAMKRWQNALGVLPRPRSKRDLIERLASRIKNIIPKYLRHKVNPKLKEKKKGAHQQDNKTSKKKKRGHQKRKKTTLTTAATPNTKTTTQKTTTVTKSQKTSIIAAKKTRKSSSIKRRKKTDRH